jgi:HD-GYP domain-containing protein (c-di-GMP phosphodiesterase class II)
MKQLLSRGTNGTSGYTPLWARVQEGRRWASLPAGKVRAWVHDPVAVYLGILIALCAILVSLSLHAGYGVGEPWAVLVLAAAAAVSERQRVTIGQDTEASISLIPILLAAVLFGPLAGMVVAAVSYLGAFGAPHMKWAVYTCSHSITGAVAGFVAAATLANASSRSLALLVATALAAVAAEVCETAFFALTMRLRGKDTVEAVKHLAPVAFASVLLYAPLVGLLVIAYEEVSPLTLPLFLAPALAAQRLFGLYQNQLRLFDDLAQAHVRRERANLSFVRSLVTTLDARDRYTAGHSAAVAIYARDIAERLGRSEDEQQLAHMCGLVHDVGKIGLPAGLLEKPGALTLAERRVMETHSEISERILAEVEDFNDIATIVRHHHERWDGQGYPDRRAGDEIPLISRILAVADAYNAMTSDRPYRDAMPSRVARMRLAQGVETQFDTTVVAAFEAVLAGAGEDYRLAKREDFTFGRQDRYSGATTDKPDLELAVGAA